jgi:hypothetical protein
MMRGRALFFFKVEGKAKVKVIASLNIETV